MSRDAEGVLFRGRSSCSRHQSMRLAAGAGLAGGRRRVTGRRSGLRLSASAPPPRPSTPNHSESEGTSVASTGGGRDEKKSQQAASRRRALLGVDGGAATTCDTRPPEAADVSGPAPNKPATRTRKPQSTTERPTAARRTVRFDHCVRMVLVPARRDLDEAIVHGVWWGAEDQAQFREAAAKYFLKNDGGTNQSSSSGGGGGDATLSEQEPEKQEGGTVPPMIGMPAPPPLPDKAMGY